MSATSSNNNGQVFLDNTHLNQGKPYKLYGTNTTNSWKIKIFFDELGIDYVYQPVDIFNPTSDTRKEVLELFANGKVPAIIDYTVNPPLKLFESGAILLYLAQKHSNSKSNGQIQLLPDFASDPHGHAEVVQWLTWQIAGLGPMNGQYTHYACFSPVPVPLAEERYLKETDRLYTVLDKQLEGKQWIASDRYSLADISVYAWAVYIREGLLPTYKKYTNVLAWLDRMNQRPAVSKHVSSIIDPLKIEIEHMKKAGTYRIKFD